jgi:hypothetical protein
MLDLFTWLAAEAAKLPQDDNPLLGSQKEPGDQVIGKLLDSEMQLLRLAAHYHDKATELTQNISPDMRSHELKEKIGRYIALSEFLENLVVKNVWYRLEWVEPKFAFLEDGSIASFVGEPEQIEAVAVIVAEEVPSVLDEKSKTKLN